MLDPIKSWGVGITTDPDNPPSYGFPETRNPNLFVPDYEASENSEIIQWIKDLSIWNRQRGESC